jgi:hypothetical protein
LVDFRGGYRCINYASDGGVTLIREEEHLGRWSTPKGEREIDTNKASDLKCHSWYRNTMTATERREMNGCWDLDPIKEGFYKLL